MKRIVIAGLLDSQSAQLKKYPHLDIRFARKDKLQQWSSAANVDEFVIMTKFISHAQTDNIPKHKIRYVNGGMTDLRQQLDLMNFANAVLSSPDTPKTPQEPDMSKLNFRPLLNTKPGETLIVQRPTKATLDEFRLMVQQGRSYYKRTHFIESEQVITGGGNRAVITVTSRRDTPVAPAVVEIPKPEPQVVAAAPVPEITESYSPYAVSLWTQVLLGAQRLVPGRPMRSIIEDADMALNAFLRNFK